MERQKKRYRPIAGQKPWERVLDWMTHEKNFKWSLILLSLYIISLLLLVYLVCNVLELPDLADLILMVWYGSFPLVVAIAFINPLAAGWGLRMEQKLQQPIKDYIAQHGSCTYDELVAQFMPVKIHLGINAALVRLLRSHNLVLDKGCYRLPTQEEQVILHKALLAEYGVRISFSDLEKIFSLDLYETEGSTSVEFSLLDELDGDYGIWKDMDEASGKEQFFFSPAPKLKQEFTSFRALSEADLFNGKNLREVWNNAVITFLNDHGDIKEWLEKHI